jgi:hypothetical protein
MSFDKHEPQHLSRRQVLAHSLAWLGTAMTVTQWQSLSEAAAANPESAPQFLDRRRFATLTAAVDTLVPRTDTPGALDANVHRFIDRLLAEWAAPERQAEWLAGLAEFDRQAQAAGADSFAGSTAEQQLALLQSLDDAAYADGGSDGFYPAFKKLVLFAFYSSEVGATEELRYQRLPGEYRPCLPFTATDRPWFWNGYAYEL